MNRAFTLVVSLLLFAGSLAAQSAKSTAELNGLLKEFLVGAGKNDAAIHERFWAEDLIYTRSAGARITKEELMKGVRSSPAPKADDPVTEYSAENVQIHTYGSTAVVAFKLVGKTLKKDGSTDFNEFLNTGTFVRRSGRWQAVAWQATAIPKPKPQVTAVEPTPEPKVEKAVKVPGRTYVRGPQGGCYYLNASGKKTYVNKDLCS
ncbi:MAG: nuclear transport factor 2 family protein [Pyrinomonadaceae bacterium]